jgi:hypothetical protein
MCVLTERGSQPASVEARLFRLRAREPVRSHLLQLLLAEEQPSQRLECSGMCTNEPRVSTDVLVDRQEIALTFELAGGAAAKRLVGVLPDTRDFAGALEVVVFRGAMEGAGERQEASCGGRRQGARGKG